MAGTLRDRVAVVTGASRGIGRAIALELARRGAHIVALARTQGALEELDDEARAAGSSATLVPVDLKDFPAIDRLGAAIHERWKRLDILIGSAGILGRLSPLGHIEPRTWDDVMAINVTAAFLCTQAATAMMRENDPSGGCIINILDRGAIDPWPAYPHHGVSKAALWMLTQVSAASLGPDIRVNAVIPGPVMKPAGTNMTDEDAAKLYALLSLQTMIITNDSLKRPNYPGDYKTPEQRIPDLKELDGKDWETCMTMNETWGYKSYANNWKSVETLVRNLIDIASKGGNYLLNVGPKSDGTFPQESIDILKAMGVWMKVNSEAIYDTKANPLAPVAWGRITSKQSGKGTILYLSVFDWPKDGKLFVPGLTYEVVSAKLLASGESVKSKSENNGLTITLPDKPLDSIATVIKVEVKGITGDQKTALKDK